MSSAFRIPRGGEIGYCCVLGELGEVLGLVVYLGTEGLEQHRKIQSGKLHAGSPEFIYSQLCLTAWFSNRSELDKTDLKVVKQLGLKFHSNNAWPQFRSFQAGYYPRCPTSRFELTDGAATTFQFP